MREHKWENNHGFVSFWNFVNRKQSKTSCTFLLVCVLPTLSLVGQVFSASDIDQLLCLFGKDDDETQHCAQSQCTSIN